MVFLLGQHSFLSQFYHKIILFIGKWQKIFNVRIVFAMFFVRSCAGFEEKDSWFTSQLTLVCVNSS
uniref:Candidate secreted effector n=1 Tax=Meloidogyne incognita TaxID=6306 RepID=A0A914KWQ7_MELIC